MKRLLPAILAQVVILSALAAQEPSPIKPRSVFEVSGVTVIPPGQAGWELVKADKKEILFRKQDKDRICQARVTVSSSGPHDTVKGLLTTLEARKTEELSKTYNKDSLHFDHIGAKGGLCLQYSGTVGIKEASSPFSRFNFRGWFCPWQGDWSTIVDIEFSERSNSRGLAEDQLSVAKEFFDAVELSKIRR